MGMLHFRQSHQSHHHIYLRYVSISISLCKMLIIPRSNLPILNERQELQKPAFYILVGEDKNTKPKAYIVETENFRERIKDHDSKKTFSNPSDAADFCIGSSNNDWIIWKDKDGYTLDSIYRKPLE